MALLCLIPCGAFSADTQVTTAEEPTTETRGGLDSDRAAIDSVWNSFKAAVLADDKTAAVQHFNPFKRDGYAKTFDLMGNEFSEWPKTWSDPTPISIGTDVAIYVFTHAEDDGERTYSVYFVKHPHLGWLLLQL